MPTTPPPIVHNNTSTATATPSTAAAPIPKTTQPANKKGTIKAVRKEIQFPDCMLLFILSVIVMM
jgi:hypothetical protein